MPTPLRTLTILILLTSLSSSIHAQTGTGDSIRYYQRQLAGYERRIQDSLYRSDSVRYYARRLHRLMSHSRSYSAFILYSELAGANFNAFNTSIAKDGFPPITGPVSRIGLGWSHKGYNGIVIDWNIFVAGIDRVAKANGEKIQTNFSNYFELELGYAIVNRSRFDIYPYAGLSARSGQIYFNKPAAVNNNYNSIASLILNDQTTGANNSNLGYEAGLGIDWILHARKTTLGGIMLFAKFGTDGSFGKDTYRISSVDYNSGIKYGAWIADLGFKFFMRR